MLKSCCCSFLYLVARLCIATIFILSGVGKLMQFDASVSAMSSVGIPYPNILLVIAIIVELAGGIGLVLGFWTRLSSLALIVFLVLATYYFHQFWTITDPNEHKVQMINFLKNLAIFGGLLQLFAMGPGSCSVDNLCHKRCDVYVK
jgi:putative oxidoreductase